MFCSCLLESCLYNFVLSNLLVVQTAMPVDFDVAFLSMRWSKLLNLKEQDKPNLNYLLDDSILHDICWNVS
jgi:hypothetical protein